MNQHRPDQMDDYLFKVTVKTSDLNYIALIKEMALQSEEP